jgi:hypothetical protein
MANFELVDSYGLYSNCSGGCFYENRANASESHKRLGGPYPADRHHYLFELDIHFCSRPLQTKSIKHR